MTALLNQVRDLLTQQSPVRAISYGAVAVVWIVTHGAFALGLIPTPPPAFDVILAAVTGAIAILAEGIRMFAFSPATVAVIQAGAAAAAAGAAASGQTTTVVTTTAPAIATTASVQTESVTPTPDDPLPNEPDPAPDPDETGTGDS